MAKIFDKVVTTPESGFDRTLVLEPREALIYPFPYEDYTQLTIAIQSSMTTLTGDNQRMPIPNFYTQIVPIVTASDKFYCGLKNNNPYFPGENGEMFAGVYNSNVSGASNIRKAEFVSANFPLLFEDEVGSTKNSIGVKHANNTNEVVNCGPLVVPNHEYMEGPTFYSDVHVLHYTIINKGRSDQKINIKRYGFLDGNNYSNYSHMPDVEFKEFIHTVPLKDMGTFEWNLAGTAYPLPRAIFFYLPFPSWRPRIHRVSVVKRE